MGSMQLICQRCGSTRIGGRCDCPNGEIIDLIECQYCGTHMPRGDKCPCRETQSKLLIGKAS